MPPTSRGRSGISSWFSAKCQVQGSGGSLLERAEEPEMIAYSASQPSMKRLDPVLSLEEKRAQSLSRTSQPSSRGRRTVLPERGAVHRLIDGSQEAISLAEFSRSGGSLLKLHSLATPNNQVHEPFTRYSLPLASDAGLQPLLPLNQQYPSLKDFEVVKTIGCGTFARVKLVRHRASGAHLALKSLKKIEVLRLKQLQHVLSEKNILARTNHPFIICLHSAYQDQEKLHMLMEYAPGGEIFKPGTRLSLEAARFYTASIVLALEYLHSNSIVYRDLKPENLLLDKNGFLKMTDFGFAKEVSDCSGRTWTHCGTPEFLAPEIIKKEGHGKAVDWWSMGVILFEMVTGRVPFAASNANALYKVIVAGEYKIPPDTDPIAQDLIRSLLQTEASKRLGNLKGGAHDIKRHPFFEGFSWRNLVTGGALISVLPRKCQAPHRPVIEYEGDCSNFQRCAESEDDPNSPLLDLSSAELIFRGF